jgi:uncharacterized repeat protein (TIGR01451 family)
MAIFSNQATLTLNGVPTNSNIAYGEILDVLTVAKTSVEGSYTPGSLVTYAVTLRNTGNSPLTALNVTDNLGGYDFNGTTVYPLTYENGSVTLFIDGVLQPAPAVTAGPPLVISGFTIPGGGDAVIIYQARANEFASPLADGVIDNTVSVTGNGISTPITATESVNVTVEPLLSISKSITPSQVVDNDRVTYSFVIQNNGNTAVLATDDATVTDTFDPILTGLTVSFNGTAWTEGVQYTYDEATGEFATAPGQLVIPAATYVQDPTTGAYSSNPGIATLTVTGTI